MMSIFLSCVAAFALTIGIAVSDIAGPWRVAVAFDAENRSKSVPAKVDLVCTFAQRDDVLTGECGPADGPEGVAVHGKTALNAVEWSFDIGLFDGDRKQLVMFTGTISEDGASMKGTVAVAEDRGTFAAHRELCERRRSLDVAVVFGRAPPASMFRYRIGCV